MLEPTAADWRELLRLVLAQRLEINAIGSALKRASALTDAELKEIHTSFRDGGCMEF